MRAGRGAAAAAAITWLLSAKPVLAQSAVVRGSVSDELAGVLPGVVVVELDAGEQRRTTSVTDANGTYSFNDVGVGRHQLSFRLMNFAPVTRSVIVVATSR